MKIAVLLWGQYRTFDLTKWALKSLKEQHDCDIFMGIDPNQSIQNEYWNSKETTNKNIIDDAISFVQPKQYHIFNESEFHKSFNNFELCEYGKVPQLNATSNEKLFTQTDTHWKIHKPFDDSISVNLPITKIQDNQNTEILFRQYFLVNECYKMLINHIETTKTEYDIIIRLRFDMIMWSRRYPNQDFPLNKFIGPHPNFYKEDNINLLKSIYKDMYFDFRKQDYNTLSTCKMATVNTYIALSDDFWTHGMDLIEKMSKYYENLGDIMNQVRQEHFVQHEANSEHYLLRHVFNNNIEVRNVHSQNLYAMIIRSFDKEKDIQ